MRKLTLIPRFEGASSAEQNEVLCKLKGLLVDLRCQATQICCHAHGTYELVGENTNSYPPEPKPAPKELTITVEGPSGSGKTVVISEIMDMLAKRGVKTEYGNQGAYTDSCRVVTLEPALQLKSTRHPRIETVQAVKVEVDAGDAALATLSLPSGNLHQKVVDAANAVLLGLLVPQSTAAEMLAELLDMASETLKWSHDVDAVNRAAAIKEKYKHG